MKTNSGVVVLAVLFIAMFFALSGYITGYAVANKQNQQHQH